jgi:hypothetical protein
MLESLREPGRLAAGALEFSRHLQEKHNGCLLAAEELSWRHRFKTGASRRANTGLGGGSGSGYEGGGDGGGDFRDRREVAHESCVIAFGGN